MTAYGELLWSPSPERANATRLAAFQRWLKTRHGLKLSTYPELHAWSIEAPGPFWRAVADFCGVAWQKEPEGDFVPPPKGAMRGGKWFPGSRLNFAENLLRPPGIDRRGDEPAIIGLAEGTSPRIFSHDELVRDVARARAALERAGVGPGDRVAGVIANVPEAIIAMLATSALGAIWSSCSPDFGASAVCDRLSQVRPKVLFGTQAYLYGGKRFDCRATFEQSLAALDSVELVVGVDHLGEGARGEVKGRRFVSWKEFLGDGEPELTFAPRAFDDPLYILFSSGTTGVPKCITHGVGGTLLQHKKELVLHGDLGPGDRLLYYTTCGWMMWNWMVSALATGATVVTYEGSPVHPDPTTLWRALAEFEITHFGTSPKFLAASKQLGVEPRQHLAGAPLRTIFSTGAPLAPEQFAWVYESVRKDLHLASISGGTDIVSCFMLGVPTMPVHAGEIQYAGLGMAIEAWDEDGRPVRGVKGELVCTKPFPSMPVMFWNDPGGKKYDDAYFRFYSGPTEVWRHGDYVEINERGGVVVYGRSDATLNPGGVRIGTAEIYRVVEGLPEVADSLAVGRRAGDDTEIVLFVKLVGGARLDEGLEARLRSTIREKLTPRHVPRQIVAVRDIPYTRSGKKVEIAVTQAIHGEPVKNREALANPESLDEYLAMGAKA